MTGKLSIEVALSGPKSCGRGLTETDWSDNRICKEGDWYKGVEGAHMTLKSSLGDGGERKLWKMFKNSNIRSKTEESSHREMGLHARVDTNSKGGGKREAVHQACHCVTKETFTKRLILHPRTKGRGRQVYALEQRSGSVRALNKNKRRKRNPNV